MANFVIMLSPAQLYPLTLPDYPDHIFWTYRLFDSFLGVSTKDIKELEEEGWEPVGRELDAGYWLAAELPQPIDPNAPQEKPEEAILYAHSQLSRTFFIHQQGGTTGRTWIQHENLQHALRYPVLLCYMMPKELVSTMNQAEIIVGTHALIETEQGIRLYSVDQLGDEGDHAWQDIHLPNIPMRASANDLVNHLDRVNLHREIQSHLYERAAQAAKKLAQYYWQLHEHSLAHPPQLSDLPDIFENATIVPMPPPIAVRGVLAAWSNAQSGADAWEKNPAPSYVYQEGKNSAQVAFHPISGEPIWEQIRQFTDLDGDILLELIAQWLVSPTSDYTWITAEHLLHYRGILPRRYVATDGRQQPYRYRYEELLQISASMNKLRNTYVTVQQWMAQKTNGQRRRGRPAKQILKAESYLIQISDFIQQARLFHDEFTQIAIAWRYSLGRVIIQFLEENQRISSWLRQSLGYDPLKEAWEKRLSRFLIFQSNDRTISIRRLFTELSFPKNEKNPDKSRQRFEKALNRLAKDLEYFSWSYIQDLAQLPPKKWFEHWLDMQVKLCIPGGKLPEHQLQRKEKGGEKSQ